MYRLIVFLILLFAGCQRPTEVVLTYAPVAPAAEDEESVSVDMDEVFGVVVWRVYDSGLPCLVTLDDSKQIRVESYVDDPETLDRIDRVVCNPGAFEFRIAANSVDHSRLISLAGETEGREVRDEQGRVLGWWVPVREEMDVGLLAALELTTRAFDRDGISGLELLVADDPYQIDNNLIVEVTAGRDQGGRPNISFRLSEKGGEMMRGLTTENLPDPTTRRTRKLAILVNGEVYSTPAIQSTIGERGEITGDFTEKEAEDLASVLNGGKLPVALEPVSVEYVRE